MEKAEQNLERPSKRREYMEKPQHICIVHFSGITYGTFKQFKDEKTPAKFNKVLEIKKRKLDEPITSPTHIQQQCNLIPGNINDHHGYHWNCYKQFTGNLDRFGPISPSTSESSQSMRPKWSSSDKDLVIFKPDCIFCNSEGKKSIKTGGSWMTQGVSKFKTGRWESVLEMAKKKDDEKLFTWIQGIDLFACEAQFHIKCLTDYMWDTGKPSRSSPECFQWCMCHCESCFLNNGKVMKLSTLNGKCKSSLNMSTHCNPHHRNENLKKKLFKRFIGQLVFTEMKATCPYQSAIVFSAALDVKSAIRESFGVNNILILLNYSNCTLVLFVPAWNIAFISEVLPLILLFSLGLNQRLSAWLVIPPRPRLLTLCLFAARWLLYLFSTAINLVTALMN